MATSDCFNGFWRLTRLSPTTTAESEHDVHVAVIALYRHWRGAELTRPAGNGICCGLATAFVIIGSLTILLVMGSRLVFTDDFREEGFPGIVFKSW
jgi:hypothetical protein